MSTVRERSCFDQELQSAEKRLAVVKNRQGREMIFFRTQPGVRFNSQKRGKMF